MNEHITKFLQDNPTIAKDFAERLVESDNTLAGSLTAAIAGHGDLEQKLVHDVVEKYLEDVRQELKNEEVRAKNLEKIKSLFNCD